MSNHETLSITSRCPCGAEVDLYGEGPWRAEDAAKAHAAWIDRHADHRTAPSPDTHQDSPTDAWYPRRLEEERERLREHIDRADCILGNLEDVLTEAHEPTTLRAVQQARGVLAGDGDTDPGSGL